MSYKYAVTWWHFKYGTTWIDKETLKEANDLAIDAGKIWVGVEIKECGEDGVWRNAKRDS